jgi:hypothetical protein
MKNIIFAFLFLLSFNAYSFDEWTSADKEHEAAYLTIDAIDWLQTRNIASNPNALYETNPILGKHPSIGSVNSYFISMMLIHVGIVSALPSKYRSTFQFTSIAYEASYVYGNFRVGINAKF